MQASRQCLYNYIPLSSRNIIPPRSTWDIMSSAARACVALVVDQENRESFVECCNKGIIEPPVLGQANFGLAMMLALYNDLNSPLFNRYKDNFNAAEFFRGVKPSLARFHDIQCLLQNDLNKYKHENSSSVSYDDKSDFDIDGYDKSHLGSKDQCNNDSVIEDIIASLKILDEAVVKTMGFMNKGQVKNILKHSWDHEAEKKSNSRAAQLKRMVTCEYFQDLQIRTKSNFILNHNLLYEEGSTKVQNAALLSVRSKKIFPEVGPVDQIKSMSKQTGSLVEEDFFDEIPEDDIEFPVVVQVEVLYDIEQRFKKIEEYDETEVSCTNEIVEQHPILKKGVLVGVFEGWLHGGLAEADSLRWSLCLSRPAWEFPGLSSATDT